MFQFIPDSRLVNHGMVLIIGVRSPVISNCYLISAGAIPGMLSYNLQIFKAWRTFPHMTDQHADNEEPTPGVGKVRQFYVCRLPSSL